MRVVPISVLLLLVLVPEGAVGQTLPVAGAFDDACGIALDSKLQAAYDLACPKEPKAPNAKSDPTCDRWWNLRQTGILAARRLVAEKRGVDVCQAGSGVVAAQIDTGVVDTHTEYPNPLAPLDEASVHSHLRARHAIVTTTRDGDTLPMSYAVGPKGTPACQTGDLAKHGEGCAPRDIAAAVVPRDDLFKFGLPIFKMGGHGTRTMDVLLQAVPAVKVVPYKFAASILVTQGRSVQLADAITSVALEDRLAHGDGGRFDVITMSLGRRSPANDLERAVELAEARGVIVVSAAGQYVYPGTSTRFPAAFPGVIAVTGSTVTLEPWMKAGRGPLNLVAAPALDVWRATWARGRPLTEAYGRGEGTSFAAPLVAATAAMWLQYHGRHELDRTYGRATVPAVFRWILRHHGTRSPKAVCDDLLTPSGDTRWDAICPAPATWDTDLWGRGILAADLVLKQPLPTREKVCAEVLRERGAEAHQRICSTPIVTRYEVGDARLLAKRPVRRTPAELTYVFGATVWSNAPAFSPDLRPTVSAGLIFSGNETESPMGPFLQGTLGYHEQRIGVGYGWTAEYAANGPRNRLDIVPVFGPTLGVAAKLVAVRTDPGRPPAETASDPEARWHLGPELQFTYYKYRVQIGWYRGKPDGEPRKWRFGWTLGVGF